jgi:hypothetical protein
MALSKNNGLGLSVLAFAAVASIAVSNFSILGECRNEIVSESNSPGNAMKYVVFQRDCGATTGFSTQISLLDGDQDMDNEAGNLFVADTNHGEAPAGTGGGPEVRISWLSKEKLQIHYHPAARIIRAEKGFKGISVNYGTFK